MRHSHDVMCSGRRATMFARWWLERDMSCRPYKGVGMWMLKTAENATEIHWEGMNFDAEDTAILDRYHQVTRTGNICTSGACWFASLAWPFRSEPRSSVPEGVIDVAASQGPAWKTFCAPEHVAAMSVSQLIWHFIRYQTQIVVSFIQSLFCFRHWCSEQQVQQNRKRQETLQSAPENDWTCAILTLLVSKDPFALCCSNQIPDPICTFRVCPPDWGMWICKMETALSLVWQSVSRHPESPALRYLTADRTVGCLSYRQVLG